MPLFSKAVPSLISAVPKVRREISSIFLGVYARSWRSQEELENKRKFEKRRERKKRKHTKKKEEGRMERK